MRLGGGKRDVCHQLLQKSWAGSKSSYISFIVSIGNFSPKYCQRTSSIYGNLTYDEAASGSYSVGAGEEPSRLNGESDIPAALRASEGTGC